jgi:hypothetical protein
MKDEDARRVILLLEKMLEKQEELLRVFRQYDSDYHREIETKEGGFHEDGS